MKLRNKKTGEIIIPTDYTFATYDDGIRYGHHIYYSLAELNEEWEDYKPKEPLIKDEKIRKIVRPWANKNMVKRLTVRYRWGEGTALESCGAKITFYDDLGLRNGATYTIAELCGEEEE